MFTSSMHIQVKVTNQMSLSHILSVNLLSKAAEAETCQSSVLVFVDIYNVVFDVQMTDHNLK